MSEPDMDETWDENGDPDFCEECEFPVDDCTCDTDTDEDGDA